MEKRKGKENGKRGGSDREKKEGKGREKKKERNAALSRQGKSLFILSETLTLLECFKNHARCNAPLHTSAIKRRVDGGKLDKAE